MRVRFVRGWWYGNYLSHVLLWSGLTLSLTACGQIRGNQYFCPPTVDYDETGKIRPTMYAVERLCYKSMTDKLAVCYTEVR